MIFQWFNVFLDQLLSCRKLGILVANELLASSPKPPIISRVFPSVYFQKKIFGLVFLVLILFCFMFFDWLLARTIPLVT